MDVQCRNRIWIFLVRKPICPRLFVIAVVTLSNITCTRKQMINGMVGGGGLFLFFVFRQLTRAAVSS